MKVAQALELLSRYHHPDEEICISWWSRDLFLDIDGEVVSEEAWGNAVDEFDKAEGYPHINEQVYDLLFSAITETESGS